VVVFLLHDAVAVQFGSGNNFFEIDVDRCSPHQL